MATYVGKPLNEDVQADLETLVRDEVREKQTLEFKCDSYLRNDDGTREMLRDVSAIANAYGGDILLGVETVGDGVASAIVGIPDGEREAQRISSWCLSNIEERIASASRKHARTRRVATCNHVPVPCSSSISSNYLRVTAPSVRCSAVIFAATVKEFEIRLVIASPGLPALKSKYVESVRISRECYP